MFPTKKGPGRILDIVDTLTVIPTFYTVHHPCFAPIHMLIVQGQLDTSFDKVVVVTGNYSWGIKDCGGRWVLDEEPEVRDEGVYFDGVHLGDVEEIELLMSEPNDG